MPFSEDVISSSQKEFSGLLHGEGNAHVARTRRQSMSRRIGAIGQLRPVGMRISAPEELPFARDSIGWNRKIGGRALRRVKIDLPGSVTHRKISALRCSESRLCV
jgi:hypothetical protein